MDSRDNFLNRLREYILTVNEEYLIGITNKGIFNRALKDLGNEQEVKVTIEEDKIKCQLPDGTICFISDDIKEFKCSCPSRNVCKHVVMSYIYVGKHVDEIFGQVIEKLEEVNSENDNSKNFSELLNIDILSIKKEVGDKEFGNIVKRLMFGLKVEVEEGTLLQVKFKEEGNLVKFIPVTGSNINESIAIKDSILIKNCLCSCKSKEMCRHKAESIIHYGIYKGVVEKDKIVTYLKNDKVVNKEELYLCLNKVRKIIEEIYITGLSRISENFVDELEQIAVICHNSNIPNFEKKIRVLQSNLELYINKNAAFSVESFRKLLQNVYMSIIAIGKCNNEEKLMTLVGKHKSTYYDIPPIEFIGIGARKWVSKSGYEGITNYFINEDFNRGFTYTSSRTTYYDDKNEYHDYETNSPWGISDKQRLFCRSRIKLINGKLNDDFRLSSSEDSKGEILDRTNISQIHLKDKTFSNWMDLFSVISEISMLDFTEREENDNLFLLKIEALGKRSFDNILQEFSMDMLDNKKKSININIKYENQNKRLIENLERISIQENPPFMFLCQIYIGENGIKAIPITAYYTNGNIFNLTMD